MAFQENNESGFFGVGKKIGNSQNCFFGAFGGVGADHRNQRSGTIMC
jgi:hypothetical protein